MQIFKEQFYANKTETFSLGSQILFPGDQKMIGFQYALT